MPASEESIPIPLFRCEGVSESDRPIVAFVTMSQWGRAYPRIARWLESGFREIGAKADIVFLEGPPALRERGGVRQVKLGARHARWTVPRLALYLRERRPVMTLATPDAIGSIAVVAGTLARQNVVPWVSTIPYLDVQDRSLPVRAHRFASRAIYAKAAYVAAVSQGVHEALAMDVARWVKPERLVVIPNPVDADEIRRCSVPLAPRNGVLRIVSTGGLTPAKGFDVLIKAFSEARAQLGDRWELVIIGDGPLRPALERLVDKCRLGDRVRFLGWLENPYPVVASADIAVQASRWEGFGIAVVEALSLGVPLIGTSCPGGISETLGHGEYGVVVPTDDVDELAAALVLLGTTPEMRRTLGELGRKRAMQYAPALVSQKIVELARLEQ